MKIKRIKHVRKVLSFYSQHFNIKAPYYTLVDGTFCKAALTNKVNIADQLPKYLDSEVKLCTTKCALKECEALGSLLFGPLKILQQYDVIPCGHEDNPSAALCLARIARKQKKEHLKFIIATQDADLSESLRKAVGVPLLYLFQKTLVLESPSEKSKKKALTLEHDKTFPNDYHLKTLEKLKTQTFGPKEQVIFRKKKKIKGPNPLSCKKKKKKVNNVNTNKQDETKKRRKRRRKSKTATNNVQVV